MDLLCGGVRGQRYSSGGFFPPKSAKSLGLSFSSGVSGSTALPSPFRGRPASLRVLVMLVPIAALMSVGVEGDVFSGEVEPLSFPSCPTDIAEDRNVLTYMVKEFPVSVKVCIHSIKTWGYTYR